MSHYKHSVKIEPPATDILVTAWDEIAGAIGEWHAIVDATSKADLSSEAGCVGDNVACDDDDYERLTAWLDDRGWPYEDEGGCEVDQDINGTLYFVVEVTD